MACCVEAARGASARRCVGILLRRLPAGYAEPIVVALLSGWLESEVPAAQ